MSVPGGIFNLEFNSDGKILAAACEKKNILIFDPLRREVVHSIDSAHTDCVNCIRWVMLSCSPLVVIATFYVSIVLKSKNNYLVLHSFCRFLDTRTFASCSDDTSVVLWDVRNLKYRVGLVRS